ncbi:hypothetical protein ILYODFUR_026607 [Ilyodon furcidens]|uniref:Uncharacterized protein n=1 Tax=Ilyodon furcidens TaxID=33524 RepID=A0ABV0TBJ1_9TELE
MHREDLSAREEFTYSRTSTLERGNGTLGRRGDRSLERRPDRVERERPERDSYAVDVRASDLQLAQVEPLKHPCFSYRAWLYSVLIGVRENMVRNEGKGEHSEEFTSPEQITNTYKVGMIHSFKEGKSQSMNFE